MEKFKARATGAMKEIWTRDGMLIVEEMEISALLEMDT
jgi:hypothetical protein